jgi:hypothetical protein
VLGIKYWVANPPTGSAGFAGAGAGLAGAGAAAGAGAGSDFFAAGAFAAGAFAAGAFSVFAASTFAGAGAAGSAFGAAGSAFGAAIADPVPLASSNSKKYSDFLPNKFFSAMMPDSCCVVCVFVDMGLSGLGRMPLYKGSVTGFATLYHF